MDADDYDGDGPSARKKKKFTEFDCPGCHANNPHDGFSFNEEVLCYYCGLHFIARNRDGKLKLKEV